MSFTSDHSAQVIDAISDDGRSGLIEDPSTPQEDEIVPSSQQPLPTTEEPGSPMDEPSASFKTELNDDRLEASVIPSSLTPPPSSLVHTNGAGVGHPVGYVNSQRSGMFSPPATGFNGIKRDVNGRSGYIPPTPQHVVEASPEDLRSMLQECIGEHSKLKMEAAHHKLQYNLLSIQADEDAKRAAVEHEITRREVETLRLIEQNRQARRDLDAASQSIQAKYLQLKMWYEDLVEENDGLRQRVKLAKKVIQQKEDDRAMLLTRIRENREHFNILRSPGGLFHSALTPKTLTASTPVQHRATPRQTPKSASREARYDPDHTPFATLLQAASQENNSAPSTPTTSHRPGPRSISKHTRNVQSMSSLPTTPAGRSGTGIGGLLPSVDLVPQSEPPYHHNGRFSQHTTPVQDRNRQRRKSRESTISADDNEELENVARQALLQSVAAGSFASRGSHQSRGSRRHQQDGEEHEEEEVFESQASQAASEMLRRDPRESFEVASSVGSRDGTPAPVEKSAKLQAKLFAGVNKMGMSSPKRKFSGPGEAREDMAKRELLTSPTKKLRIAGGLRDPGRVGLGIQYSRED